jgi:hypothetical protein
VAKMSSRILAQRLIYTVATSSRDITWRDRLGGDTVCNALGEPCSATSVNIWNDCDRCVMKVPNRAIVHLERVDSEIVPNTCPRRVDRELEVLAIRLFAVLEERV